MKKITIIGAALILFATSAVPAFAKHETGQLNYFIGTGLLCGLDPAACPVIAMAENGDTVEITGEGTINLDNETVTGGGTFIHKDSQGNVVGSGTWAATELISFRSWGPGTPQGLPENFEGGRAKIRVHLTPDGGGAGFDAKLKIICAIGDFPSSAEEGITLTVRHGPNFHEEVSGFTLFIRQ